MPGMVITVFHFVTRIDTTPLSSHLGVATGIVLPLKATYPLEMGTHGDSTK